jgi:hypothetical protein
VNIRTFQPGDESVQAAIYNEAAAELPRFKPATVQEVQRRTQARDFDPTSRCYAVEGDQVLGYCLLNANGRVSYPWCRKGHEAAAGALFAHTLDAARRRGLPLLFAAYRGDWQPVADFFEANGFGLARHMVNFGVDLMDLPTAPARPSTAVTPFERADVPALLELAPGVLRLRTAAELEDWFFNNPYFGPDCLFVQRSRADNSPLAVGILIQEATYADPREVDPAMPCFRLGAFGAEGMQAKRIKGLFSFVARADHNLSALGLDLIGRATWMLRQIDDIGTLAAQVPSDAPHLLRFYERHFRKQGSFPVYERTLVAPPA